MPLEDIGQKESTITTPSAQNLAGDPQAWEGRYRFHVKTYVAMAALEDKWNAVLNNLFNNRSATGLIYADRGYGKTSTGASLWHAAEEKGIVAVPPFVWDSLADMLKAVHGWICYRLQDTRPDLIPNLNQRHEKMIEVDEQDLARRIGEGSYQEARRMITRLREEGRLSDALSPDQLLDYLRFATQMLLKAGYKGLLILPDEFELFKNSPDTAQNYQDLKNFIFGIHGEERLPIGCVAFTYNRTFADIQHHSAQKLDRFDKPTGTLIDLEQFYGQIDFANHLWGKLTVTCQLSSSEAQAIDTDVLNALGQFLRHPRSTELISGPRSVVSAFNRAASHYIESKTPYSIFDFCDDYLSGNISYGGSQSKAVSARNQIIRLPFVENNVEAQKLIKLLCVHPEGIPKELFQKYGIPEPVRETVIQSLLGQHIMTKATGPTLNCYRDDLLGVDELNEILTILKTSFSSTDREFHRGAVRAFNKHILTAIFRQKTGASLGWTKVEEIPGNSELHHRTIAKGTVLPEYPDRTLTIDIETTETMSMFPSLKTQFHTQFILDTIGDVRSRLEIKTDGLNLRLNVQEPIDAQRVPDDIGKLGELFLPEKITPLLLLSILDFFDRSTTISMVEAAKQDTEANLLKEQIRNQLIRYFFSPDAKEDTVYDPAELSTNFVSIPAGKGFVEDVLRILIPNQFPKYSTIATSGQWQKILGAYDNVINKASNLSIKRGNEPFPTVQKNIPGLFNYSGVSTFNNKAYNVLKRELLRVEDGYGNSVDIKNSGDSVLVFFPLHRLEKLIVEKLQASSDTTIIDGKSVNIIESHHIYQQARVLGYLDEEIAALIDILKTRGMVDFHLEYLYLIENLLNFNDLKTKLEGIDKSISLAESSGFVYKCDHITKAHRLVSIDGIENSEERKDELRQQLNSAETHLEQECQEWLKTQEEYLKAKTPLLERFRRQLQIPSDLEPKTDYPLTKFSEVLFDSIRKKICSVYTQLSGDIQKLQEEIQQTIEQEVQIYESDPIPHNAIETAGRLKDFCSSVDVKLEALKKRKEASVELFNLFQEWRVLTSQVVRDKRLMDKVEGAENLIGKLEKIEEGIRQHLADDRMDLRDVLGNCEHFEGQIDEIKSEFDQYLGGKEEAFIAYRIDIEKKVKKVIDASHIRVKWDPAEIDGCYDETRKEAVAKLKNFVAISKEGIDKITKALFSPIKTYVVPESLKNSAVQLDGDIRSCTKQFQDIHSHLLTENVDSDLSKWVSDLQSLWEKGKEIRKRWEKLEKDMIEFRNQLNPSTQKLHNAIDPLLKNGTFNSASEIIERLQELYQLN